MKKEYNPMLAQLAQVAQEHGVAIQYVFPTKQGEETFAYTVGLEQNYNHPELLLICAMRPNIIGYTLNMAHNFIKGVANSSPELVDRPALQLDTRDSRFYDRLDVAFKQVSDIERTRSYATAAHAIAQIELGRDARIIQVVIPDANNRLPWDEGYDAVKMASQKILFDYVH